MGSRSLPLFAFALAVLAAAMLMPAGLSAVAADWRSARSFLYAAIASGFAAAILGVALSGRKLLPESQGEIATLLACWVFLPAFAALPLTLLTPQIGFVGAWFEMTSALTTTGGTLYAKPESLPMPLHLWRATVGWLGGLLTLTAAYAILAPRRLGGFEVLIQSAGRDAVEDIGAAALGSAPAPIEDRIRRALRNIVPVYALLTAVLALALNALGEAGLPGLIHAMAILSTSGITPFHGGFAGTPNFWIEAVAAVFLVLASTRLVYSRASQIGRRTMPWRDPEIRLMAALVTVTTGALFARHWFGALTVEAPGGTDMMDALRAFWGGFFTSLSFLTTFGLESGYWEASRNWSGLSSPELALFGLCAIGGGAATTAGGIKLLRAAALLGHGRREIERLAQPIAVHGAGLDGRGFIQQGAFIAWTFVMLYIFTTFVMMLGLALTGMPFDKALVAAVSALTNTGPALSLVSAGAVSFELLDTTERVILATTMILGRIETLVFVALLSPEAWRSMRSRKKIAGKRRSVPSESRW